MRGVLILKLSVKRMSCEAGSRIRAAACKSVSIPIIITSPSNGVAKFVRMASGVFRIDRSRFRMELGGRNCHRFQYKA